MPPIRWNEPRFDEDELKEVASVLRNSYVNEGPKTKELEEQLKKYLGVKHVMLVANATAGLFLAIKAEAILRGKNNFEIIVPDFTMFATASAVNWAGGTPIPVDVEGERFTIDVSKIEEKITDKTIAIIPVHILGRQAEMSSLKNLAKRYNLAIIEDAAGALGSKTKEGPIGVSGAAGVFSLQSNKIITSGQGGVIVTNDDVSNETMRRLRDFGRMSNKEFLHSREGYNLKFSDLAAALAIAQLRKIDSRKQLLKEQLTLYRAELEGLSEVHFPPTRIEEGEVPLWIDVVVKNRTELVHHLNVHDIFSRECWPALHRNTPYKHNGNDAAFPVSSFISDNVLWLPNGPALSNEDIVRVCQSIKEFYQNAYKP